VSNIHGCADTSEIVNLFELDAPEFNFIVSGPDTVCLNQVFNTNISIDENFSNYNWSNGSTNSNINVNAVGNYILTVSNGTCPYSDTVNIVYEAFTRPEILIIGDTAFCLGESSELYLAKEYETYEWSSGSFTPNIDVNHSGQYWVDLIDSNGCEYRSEIVEIYVDPMPLANFNFSAPDTIISFSSYSDHANTFNWNFGDGNYSNAENPVNNYSSVGDFEVTLTVQNACGIDSLTQLVTVRPKELVDVQEVLSSDIEIFPVPSHGWVNLRMKNFNGNNYNIEVYNSLGQRVHSQTGHQSFIQMNLSYLAKGTYTLKLSVDGNVFAKKIILE